MPEKFVCNKCGKCCNQDIAIDEKDSAIEYGFGTLFCGATKSGIPLPDSEKKEIESQAKEKGKKIEIVPLRSFFDLKSKTWIVVQWKMLGKNCQFSSGKECLIYKNRPMVCKYWPLSQSGKECAISDNCIGFSAKKERIAGNNKKTALFFWEELIALNQAMAAFQATVSLLLETGKAGAVSLSRNTPKKSIEENCLETKTKGILEFIANAAGISESALLCGIKKASSRKKISEKQKSTLA